jgi:hypothetical protein
MKKMDQTCWFPEKWMLSYLETDQCRGFPPSPTRSLAQDVLAVSKIGIDGVSLQVPAVWQKPDPHDSRLEGPVAGQNCCGWWCYIGVNIQKNVAKHVFFRKMIYKWWMFHIWRVQGVSGVKKMWLIVIRWWEARATPKTTRTVKVSRSLSSAVGGNQPFGPLRHFGPHFGAEEGVGDVNVGSPESESLRRRNFRIQLSCFSFSWWSCLIIIHDHK